MKASEYTNHQLTRLHRDMIRHLRAENPARKVVAAGFVISVTNSGASLVSRYMTDMAPGIMEAKTAL
jgi:hypothetical protein